MPVYKSVPNLEDKLENLIKNEIRYNKNYSIIREQDSGIEQNNIFRYNNELLEDVLEDYASNGYEILDRTEIKKPTEEVKPGAAPGVEVSEGLPAEYKPLMAALSQEHAGIRYTGIVHLTDKSQHNVDILTFEYEEDGETKQMHVVAKDWDEKEEKIPAFLNELGIKTHSIYDTNTRLLIEHVGYKELRDVVRKGSESDVRKACAKALDKISQIHVLASLNIEMLENEHGLVLDVMDYKAQFRSRFLEPVSGNSLIISPQMDNLIQAYAAFSGRFVPSSFTHGDSHTGNFRLSEVAEEECFVVDYEWAKIGIKFDDLSRFTNSVIRDRPDIDVSDFTREQLTTYIEMHNEHAAENQSPLLMQNERLAASLRYSLINDEIYKVGEYITFGAKHPKVKEEKMHKSQECFKRAVRMLDGSIEYANKIGDNSESEMLSRLKHSLIDYVATSPIKELSNIAETYKTGYKKESLILVPAA